MYVKLGMQNIFLVFSLTLVIYLLLKSCNKGVSFSVINLSKCIKLDKCKIIKMCSAHRSYITKVTYKLLKQDHSNCHLQHKNITNAYQFRYTKAGTHVNFSFNFRDFWCCQKTNNSRKCNQYFEIQIWYQVKSITFSAWQAKYSKQVYHIYQANKYNIYSWIISTIIIMQHQHYLWNRVLN